MVADIHKVIGKISFKPNKGLVLPKHRYTGPYNPLHLQLDFPDRIAVTDTSEVSLMCSASMVGSCL